MKRKISVIVAAFIFAGSIQSTAAVHLHQEQAEKLGQQTETDTSITAPVTALGSSLLAYGLFAVPVAVFFGYQILANGRVRGERGRFVDAQYKQPVLQYLWNRN